MRAIVVFVLLLLCLSTTHSAPAIPYIPVAISAASYCNMNPHACVRLMVNTYEHAIRISDEFAERQRQVREEQEKYRAMQEKYNQFKKEHNNMRPFPGLR